MQPFGWTASLPKDETILTAAGNQAVAALRKVHGKVYAEGSICELQAAVAVTVAHFPVVVCIADTISEQWHFCTRY